MTMTTEQFQAERARMREVIKMTDEQREAAGYRSPLSQIVKDYECNVFHYIHPRFHMEYVYTPCLERSLELMKQRDDRNALKPSINEEEMKNEVV